MIVSGVKDYRVAYKSYQDWLVPRYAVVSVFFVGVVFLVIGLILLLVGLGSGLTSAGAVFMGLGLSLLAICLLLCLHAYCVRYIRDQSTQTKDPETQVKEVLAPSYAVVTSKPPQGVLKTGRSPSTEPKRVRLQAERDTGLSSGHTQSLSSQFLTERFPLRTPELKEEEKRSQSQFSKTTSLSESSQATENHYETLPLKVEADPAASRRAGEVFSRSQEAQVSRQVGSTQVVYPQQATVHQVTRFDPPPPPAYPPPSTNLSSSFSTSAYRSGSPSFSQDVSQQAILTSPRSMASASSSTSAYRSGSPSFSPDVSQQSILTAPRSMSSASSSTSAYRSGSPSFSRDVSQQSILTSPHPMASGQYRQSSEQHFHTTSQSRSGGNIQHFHAQTAQPRAASSVQQYHVTSDTRPIKLEQHYQTAPQPMTAHQRQMTSEYHWAGMGSYNPTVAGQSTGQSAGQGMSFEDHRSSKMSLYDNLDGWTDGGATI